MERSGFRNEQTVIGHRAEDSMEEFHERYEEAVEEARADLGGYHAHVIDGEPMDSDEWFTAVSSGDLDAVVGRFADGDAEDVDRAVEAAVEASEGWSSVEPVERAEVFRDAASLTRDRKYRLAAALTLENGKSRLEAMAEVDEAIDFLEFYSREVIDHDGYRYSTGEVTEGERCSTRLEPFGVFAVVSPFNFPVAIYTGMTVGALVTGNTTVTKPATSTSLSAHRMMEVFEEAGVPDGAVNLVTGGGLEVGKPLVEHEDVDGVAFTGSREVGREIQRGFFDRRKNGPVLAELGGKNPVVVSRHADVEDAVAGVKNGAFGYSGQKCSATSRVYVHDDVYQEFVDGLTEEVEDVDVVEPTEKDCLVSPLIDDGALERYMRLMEEAAGVGTVAAGGGVVESDDLPDGRYVEPVVAVDVPHEHSVARDEHFLPFVTLHRVESLEEGIELSNDSDYGLCAGLFSESESEVERWLDEVESGMCYVNRGKSATTGAQVRLQPFGGWKESATSSKFAGGEWYLPQFTRQQTLTVVE